MKTSLPPSELTEVPLCALGSSALKTRAQLGDPVARGQHGFARMCLSIGIDREVADTEINTEPAFGVDGRSIRNLDGHKQEKLALSVDEVGLASSAFKTCSMVGTNSAWDDYPTIQREQTHSVESVLEAVEALVVGDGAVLSKVGELGTISAVSLADLRDRSHCMLGRQAEHVAKVPVVELLQPNLVGSLQFKGSLRKPGACLVHAGQSSKKSSLLVIVYKQFDGCNELHKYRGSTSMRNINHKSEQRFLPALGRGFRAGDTVTVRNVSRRPGELAASSPDNLAPQLAPNTSRRHLNAANRAHRDRCNVRNLPGVFCHLDFLFVELRRVCNTYRLQHLLHRMSCIHRAPLTGTIQAL